MICLLKKFLIIFKTSKNYYHKEMTEYISLLKLYDGYMEIHYNIFSSFVHMLVSIMKS